jgi:hypothetical protein
MQDEIEKAKAQAAQLAALTSSSSTVISPKSLQEIYQSFSRRPKSVDIRQFH